MAKKVESKDPWKAKFMEAKQIGAPDIAAIMYADGSITLTQIMEKFGKQ